MRDGSVGEVDLLLLALGPRCESIAPSVRFAHRAPLISRGAFDIMTPRGNRLARALCLPSSGTDVPVELVATPTPSGARWHRRFGSDTFDTIIEVREGQLVESSTMCSLRFEIEPSDGGVRYRQMAFQPRRRIPRRLQPLVEAVVLPEGEGWRVDVAVRLPFLGVVCRYGGRMEAV